MSVYEIMSDMFSRMTSDERIRTFRHEMIHQLSDLNAYIDIISFVDLQGPNAKDEVQQYTNALRKSTNNIKELVTALVEKSTQGTSS